MVAGPIMRATSFFPQCLQPSPFSAEALVSGARLLVLGLFEKIVLADWAFAPTADRIFKVDLQHDWMSTWTGVVAFAFQIFFDFAGYSTAAVGVARMLGFSLPPNFNSPYAATSLSDFWKRWHISLSSWLRDYLYIPLGGNRGGRWRTHFNLTTTMLIGGLWHGAALRFIAWGGLHGLLLVGQRELTPKEPSSLAIPFRPLAAALTVFVAVCFTWVFFRATSLGHSLALCRTMLGAGPGADSLPGLTLIATWTLAVACLTCHWLTRDLSIDAIWERWRPTNRALACAAMVLLMLLSPDDNRTFIYFHF
jgi:alginate O-acetyltransferase complex protein AlgI